MEEAKTFMELSSKSSSDEKSGVQSMKRKRGSNVGENEVQYLIQLFFDGGSRGNPGNAGAGAHIQISRRDKDDTEDDQVIQIREFCGSKQTNNFAEYTGLLVGLKEVKKVLDRVCLQIETDCENGEDNKTYTINVEIRGDSNLIMQQLSGTASVKKDTLKRLYKQCTDLIADIRSKATSEVAGESAISLSVDHSHVYRESNKIADSKFFMKVIYQFGTHLSCCFNHKQNLQMKPWTNEEAG